MKLAAVTFALLLAGCASQPVPVQPKFPQAPKVEPCADLKKFVDNSTLSQVAEVIDYNYTLYHLCALNSETWDRWYKEQKKLYEAKR